MFENNRSGKSLNTDAYVQRPAAGRGAEEVSEDALGEKKYSSSGPVL